MRPKILNDKGQVMGMNGGGEDIHARTPIDEQIRTLTSVVEQTADHVMITDMKGMILYVNPAFEKTTGYTAAEVLGKTPKILKSGEHGKDYYAKLWSTILAGKTFYAQTTNKNKKGQLYVADQTISPIKNEKGEITHFVSVWKDITEKIRMEEQLKTEKRKLEEIIGFDEKVSSIRKFESLFDFVVDKTAEILNAGKCSIMLIDPHEKELCIKGARGFTKGFFKQRLKIGEPIAGLVAREGRPLLVKDIEQCPELKEAAEFSHLGRSFISVPITLDHERIGVINVAQKGMKKDEPFDEIDLKILCSIAREVAVAIENVRMYRELNFLTITDSLTHLHNFRHFNKTLDYELKRRKRTARPLSLLIVDIDDFKSYNEQFGHPEGNKLLEGIGEIIQSNVREIDVPCRYGADEFIVILPETQKEGSEVAAERLRKTVEQAAFQRPVTISIGGGTHAPKMDRRELISKADNALYQAKHEGKNRVCVFG